MYSSVSDVTWTKDANLLGTWIASSSDADGNGTVDIIDAIIAASPTISNMPNEYTPSGTYTVTASDFEINGINGRTTWFGAMAYVNYLNSISYGDSNQWYLPTVANTFYGVNSPTNGTAKGDELVELFYSELNGTAYYAIPETSNFDNEQYGNYWSGTEAYGPDILDPSDAWALYTGGYSGGYQEYLFKGGQEFAWAVTAGNLSASSVSAVPAPAAAWLLATGLPLVAGVARRRNKDA